MPIAQIAAASSCGMVAIRDTADSWKSSPKKTPPNSFALFGGSLNRSGFSSYKDWIKSQAAGLSFS
jgi:hypothetical protein